jgi:glycosyltransferase involved in cell wall biosynthesis
LHTYITLHGHVPHAEVGEHIASFDLVLAPFGARVGVHGGGDVSIERWISPLKSFEYMSHAKPIMATDLPVIREILTHEETALLVPPEDIAAWEKTLARLSQDPELGRRLAANAFAEFEAHYSWTARARSVIEGLPANASS